MLSKVLNKLWLYTLQKENRAFAQNFRNSQEIQEEILFSYLKKCADTVFGKKYEFSSISTYEEFVKTIPIVDNYSFIEKYTSLIADGEKKVLYNDETLFFEETSGSRSASKLIPYTPQLKDEFNRAFAPWIHTMNRLYPGAFAGKAYWSISPPLKKQSKTKAGIRVGIADDTEYLNGIVKKLYSYVTAVDIAKMNYHDGESFFVETWKQLLSTTNLSMISVWSPSFLLQLDRVLERNYEELRTSSMPVNFSEVNLSILFPNCKVVSCWTEGSAELFIDELKEIVGGIPIHPKGLLMTEGVISTPFEDANYLAYRSHFYEFVNKDGKCFRSHEIEKGKQYTVVITTGGGLFRYNTHDFVEVLSIKDTVPCLMFVGRDNKTSDMVGEKLAEQQLIGIVKKLKSDDLIEYLFCFPLIEDGRSFYRFVLCCDEGKRSLVEQYIKKELRKNPYYDQAIKMGQLSEELFLYEGKGYREEILFRYAEEKGMKVGDVKLGCLVM